MKSYSNQPYHELLDRHRAVELLAKLSTKVKESFEIPMVVIRRQNEEWKTDSNAEQEFLSILEKYGFPNPTDLQYKIDLMNGEYTFADFAYNDELPSKTVLIFVDGLSKKIHGNPEAQLKDKLKRVKLRMKGYNVIETSARGLKDETNLIAFLQELNLYLDKWRS
jgi:hypothetical protein